MNVRFSDDEKYAYLEGVGSGGFWMSTKMYDAGTYQQMYPKPGWLDPGGVQFKHVDGVSPNYERFVLTFQFWKVSARFHITKDLRADDLFVLDYKLHKTYRDSLGL